MSGLRRILAALVLLSPGLAPAQKLTIAAASDLGLALKEIASDFERQHHAKVAIVLGSSGNLYQQIRNGAPFDVFLSADAQYPSDLHKDGLADAPIVYATGRLALLCSAGVPRAGATRPRIADLLTDPTLTHLAIANPQHAPYGRAAVALLEKLGIKDQVESRLVRAENIAQAVQFVDSGNAEVGIVALSLVNQRKDGWTKVPEELYPAIEQSGVVIARSPEQKIGAAFLTFLQSETAKTVLRKYGFGVR